MADTKIVLRSKSKTAKGHRSNSIHRTQSLRNGLQTNRHESIGAIEELIQCGICLEKLTESRMLPCQHTFCLSCLQSHLTANLLFSRDPQNPSIKCAICQRKVPLVEGTISLEKLPKNLYIDSLLKVISGTSTEVAKPNDWRCVKCQTITKDTQQCCQHCMQVFCSVCWTGHLRELESNLLLLVKQVEESQVRLDHKLEDFNTRCEQLVENIEEAALAKVEEIKRTQSETLKEVGMIKNSAWVTYDVINTNICEMKEKLASNPLGGDGSKVNSFMALHRETTSLLNQVNHYGESRVIFDANTFRLDQDTDENFVQMNEDPSSPTLNPLENIDSIFHYYKTRSYTPKLVWNKCPRPAHVAVSPWDPQLLYITATDTHTVLILNTNKKKLEGRLTSPEMLYPQGIALSKVNNEIYVSDKWKHCIHVFASNGDYKRTILSKDKVRSPDGLAMGPNEELVICDRGNDRVLVVDPKSSELISIIGLLNNKTLLNMPTGVAVSGERIIVADTGNHRIKCFGFDGQILLEFGTLGRERGQLRLAEVVTVDPRGNILVGDGGNARVQVFTPDGALMKVFGVVGKSKPGWVSGICMSQELDIIVTDSKNKCLTVF